MNFCPNKPRSHLVGESGLRLACEHAPLPVINYAMDASFCFVYEIFGVGCPANGGSAAGAMRGHATMGIEFSLEAFGVSAPCLYVDQYPALPSKMLPRNSSK